MSSSDGSRHHAYNRKDKSLGLLCSNFLNLYNRDGVDFIGLDNAATRLGVERRRIYDIVNVLESVGVMSRKAKNQYSWKGFAAVPQALEDLRNGALREKFGNDTAGSDGCLKVLDDDEDEALLDRRGDERIQSKLNPNSDLEAPSFCNLSSRIKAVTENRREKSLGLLTQNFLKLFLTMKVNMVSLDEAANFLLGDIHGSPQMRTKVRRLYDIANVLASINLIEKTQQTENRKPAYRWLGFKEGSLNDASATSPDPQQSKKRDFGTDITNLASVKRSKLISSVDEKTIKAQMQKDVSSTQRDGTQMHSQQQRSSRSYVFGPFRPIGLQDMERKGVKRNQDWERLASSYRPEYHNQALSDLFAHYMEAWKSWYTEVAQGKNLSRNAAQLPS